MGAEGSKRPLEGIGQLSLIQILTRKVALEIIEVVGEI